MPFTLRPFIAADADAVAELLSRVDPEPITPAEVLECLTDFPWQEGAFQLLLVAEDAASGQIVGFGQVMRKAWHKPGKFIIYPAAIDPAWRRQGAGGLLLAALEAYAFEHGALEIEADVRDNDPAELAFAERRGYVMHRHVFESVMEVEGFDEAPFLPAVEQVQREFRIFTLADAPGEETERKLYELRKTTIPDQPGFDGSGAPSFELWRKQVLYCAEARHDLLLIAAVGDRFVGETYLRWNEPIRAMYTNYTGVLPEYRGRHLALALKVLGIRLARRYGALTMRTNNDSQNGPMLTVNRKLGYRAEPGLYFLTKRI